MIGSADSDNTPIKVFSISKVPTLVMPEVDITYGFVNGGGILTLRNSPLSVNFYVHSPYYLPEIYTETTNAKWYLGSLDVDSKEAKQVITRYNLSYYIKDCYFPDTFTRSLPEGRKTVLLYDNGRICIWCLDSL